MDLLARLCAISLVIAASTFTTVFCDHGDQQSVYFALMVSSAPTLNTSGVVSAVDQALELVNNDNSNVLPGVRLQYTSVLDTRVSTNIICVVLCLFNNGMEGATNKQPSMELAAICVLGGKFGPNFNRLFLE